MIHFRSQAQEIEYNYIHPKLRALVMDLERWLSLKELDLYVTSIYRAPGTIKGESGVHGTLRALDCIPDGKDWEADDMARLAEFMNDRHPRRDGKPSVIWHSHRGGGLHFHLQVAWTKDFDENKLIEEMKDKVRRSTLTSEAS